jgi:cytochrome P450
MRKALADFTFSDGTLVPKGAWIVASTYAPHADPGLYPNPEAFQPWRFYDMRHAKPESEASYVSTSIGTGFLGFGYGSHAWYVFSIYLFLKIY